MIENSNITAADIVNMQKRLAAYLTTYLPNVNLQPGSVIYDLVIKSMSHILVLVEKESLEMQARYNIQNLANSEDTTSRLMLDDVLSNWFIERKPGGLSSVPIVLELSAPLALTMDSSYIFSRAEGVTFSPTLSSGRLYGVDSYKEITADTGSKVYSITIYCTSNNPGMASSLPPGSFSLNKSIPGFIRAYSTKVSSAVTASETNYQLVQRAKESLAFRGMSTPKAILATVGDLGINSIISVEIVRAGDPEMFRDLLGSTVELFTDLHTLGKCDILVKLAKEMADTAPKSTNGSNLVTLDKDAGTDAVYYVRNVRSNGVSLIGCTFKSYVATDGTSKYLKTSRIVNDLTGLVAYSSQTVISRTLADNEYLVNYSSYLTDRSTTKENITVQLGSSKQNVVLEYIKASDLSVIEGLCESDDYAPVGIDLKSRLASVVEVSINKLKYTKNANSPLDYIPESLIKGSLASYINNRSSVITIQDILNHILTNFYQFISSVQSDIDISYVLHAPDGVCYRYSNLNSKPIDIEDLDNLLKPIDATYPQTTVISKEYLFSIGASNRTCTYYIDSDNIVMEQQ
jgi:hypothetical protein